MLPKTSVYKQGIFVLVIFLASFPFVAKAENEQTESVNIRIDADTVAKGYTIETPSQDLRVGIWPNLLNQPVTVRIIKYQKQLPTPDGLRLVSDIWEFDVLKADIDYRDPIIFSTPLTLGIRHYSGNLYGKKVYYWDRNHDQWFPLPSRRNFDSGHIYARFHLPFAQIAVFEDPTTTEGKASWLRHRYDDTAASNDFPIGSRLRVADRDTGNFTDVTVRSTGPYVDGRVVDISYEAFAALREPWRGVANVFVTLLALPE